MVDDVRLEERARGWLHELTGGVEILEREIPRAVPYALAVVMDPALCGVSDYGSVPGDNGGRSGQVFAIGGGQVVTLTFKDVDVNSDRAGSIWTDIRSASAIRKISTAPSGASLIMTTQRRGPNQILVTFKDGVNIGLPAAEDASINLPDYLAALRDAAGWSTGAPT